jgi:hypothetical protein
MKWRCVCFAIVALVACGRAEQPAATRAANQVQATVPAPGTGPNARTPLGPLTRAIDPRRSGAAEQLVHAFARLLNDGKFDEAYVLLGPNAPPRGEFDKHFAGLRDLTVTQGPTGGPEGAAGSICLSVPLTFAGTVEGKRITQSGVAVLRRVNDVPGSTEAQRRWHIERIDWTSAG